MAIKLREKIQHFQQRLTRLDQQTLGKATLLIVLFLDLFILGSIFDGLSEHSAQLTRPEEYIPALCRETVLDEAWNPSNRVEKLAQQLSDYHESYFIYNARAEHKPLQAVCAPLLDAFWAIRNDKALSRHLRDLVKTKGEIADLRSVLERSKGAYDTSLLETIAKDNTAQERVVALRQEVNDKTKVMDELVRRQAVLLETIKTNERVIVLFARIEKPTEAERRAVRDELRHLNFWFPVKRLAWEFLFLAPLFLVFYIWNARSIKRNKAFQVLVSSHLLVVTVIPAFCKLLVLVYDIIPHKLLARLMELLISLHLIAVWHYVVMALAILAALTLMYLFQRKLFSHEKLLQRRIARGLCQHCGLRLLPNSRYCTACGSDQLQACRHCQALTPVHGKHCQSCGQSNLPV